MSTAVKDNTEILLNMPLQKLIFQPGDVIKHYAGNKLELSCCFECPLNLKVT
jgi:hypothetical protein